VHRLSSRTTESLRTSSTPPISVHLGVNSLLDMRVHLDHVLVQLWVLAHHNLRIPCGGHEDGLNTTLQRCGEAVGDLETNEEGVGNHNRSEGAVAVVGRVGKDKVEVGEAVKWKLLATCVILVCGVSTYKAQMYATKVEPMVKTGPVRHSFTSASIPRSLIIVQVAFAL